MQTEEQELKNTIEDAQSKLNSLMQASQRDVAKQNRARQVEVSLATIERTDKEIENLEQKIKEASQKLDDAIKERFLSRQNYVAVGVSTAVNNTAQQFIALKDALLRKVEQRTKFVSRHAELVRLEESYAPKV